MLNKTNKLPITNLHEITCIVLGPLLLRGSSARLSDVFVMLRGGPFEKLRASLAFSWGYFRYYFGPPVHLSLPNAYLFIESTLDSNLDFLTTSDLWLTKRPRN